MSFPILMVPLSENVKREKMRRKGMRTNPSNIHVLTILIRCHIGQSTWNPLAVSLNVQTVRH